MTTEEKAKAYDEALERAKDCLTDRKFSETEDTLRSVMEYIFPELAKSENEDEKARKFLVQHISEWIGCIEHDLKISSKDIESEKELAMFKAGLAYLEKQKDASKAIEAVDRIDRYIDGHVANAHDMKDSNPDKKYYRGWDDALGKMSGILQDVYSGEKQKEQKPAEKQDYSGLNDFERAIHRGFLAAGIENVPVTIIKETAKECLAQMKPAKWGENDENMLNSIINVVCGVGIQSNGGLREKQVSWLKSIPERFNLQPKEEWSDEDTEMYINVASSLRGYACGLENEEHKRHIQKGLDWLENRFQSLRPSWKPSEEQMDAFEDAMTYIPEFYKPKSNLASLLRDLKKLM